MKVYTECPMSTRASLRKSLGIDGVGEPMNAMIFEYN